MKVRFQRTATGDVIVYPEEGMGVLEDLFADTGIEYISEAADVARDPTRVPDDEEGQGWGANYTRVWVRRGDVLVENVYTEEQVALTHVEFIEIVEAYLRELELVRAERAAQDL